MANWNTNSLDVAIIQNIINNNAAAGDTVTLPPGAITWTTSLSITKRITLKGQTTVTGAGPTTIAGGSGSDVFTDGQCFGSTSARFDSNSANFTTADIGKNICCSRIPGGATIIARATSSSVTLSANTTGAAATGLTFARVNCTTNDLTVITSNVTAGNAVINVSIPSTASETNAFELTGLTIKQGTGTVDALILTSTGAFPVMQVNVHHNNFVDFPAHAVYVDGWCYGVAHHNKIVPRGNGQCFNLEHKIAAGLTQGFGTWSGTEGYPGFGTNRFFFIESNTCIGAGVDPTNGATTDGSYGARFVVRYNDLTNSRPGWHGSEIKTGRGVRAVEVYNNANHWTRAPSASNRSGASLYHDNTWNGTAPGFGQHSTLENFRMDGGVSADINFRLATGISPWDQNDTDGAGGWVENAPSHRYYRGTVLSQAPTGTNFAPPGGSPAVVTMTGTSPAMVAGAFSNQGGTTGVAYQIVQVTAGSRSLNKCGEITDNTASTITYERYDNPGEDRGPTVTFNPGDTCEVYRVITLIDQCGRGRGDQVKVGAPQTSVNTRSGTELWPVQQLEPCLSWNNVHANGTRFGYTQNSPTMVEGRDYYNLGTPTPSTLWPNSGAIPNTRGAPATYAAGINSASTAYTLPFTYPHTLAGGAIPDPVIDSTQTAFTVGAANSFTVSYSNFSSAPVFSIASFNSAPSGVTPALPTGVNFSNAGVFSGTAVGAVAGNYGMTLHAVAGAQSDDGDFTLTINSGNAPTVSITAPADNATVLTSDSVTISATAAADTGRTISQVEFFDGTASLGTDATSPYSLTGLTFTAGAHTLTAVATDNVNQSTTSSAIHITASNPVAGLQAPTIVVSA